MLTESIEVLDEPGHRDGASSAPAEIETEAAWHALCAEAHRHAEASMVRQSLAVMLADIAGYSSLMEENEVATAVRVGLLWRAIVRPLATRYRAQIVRFAGDSALIAFASSRDALACALEIQATTARLERGKQPGRRIALRIGLSRGQLLFDGHDVQGTGINVAARLEAIAEPGEVLVSGAVIDDVGDRVPCVREALGHRRLRNLAREVDVYRVRPAIPGLRAAPLGPARVGPRRTRRRGSVADPLAGRHPPQRASTGSRRLRISAELLDT